MISELDGNGTEIKMADARKINKNANKRRDPNLTNIDLDAKTGTLTIESVNVNQIEVKYYLINAEIMFSRAPFLKDSAEGFSYVKPFETVNQKVEAADPNTTVRVSIPVPEGLGNKNMVIEILSPESGKQEFRTFYSNKLKITTLQTFGELKVDSLVNGKPLPRTYVKVFATNKHNPSAAPFFFRDGYTDICGKFEYAQTSGDKLKDVLRFAILIHNDDLGSKIMEIEPPKDSNDKMARLEKRQNYVKSKRM